MLKMCDVIVTNRKICEELLEKIQRFFLKKYNFWSKLYTSSRALDFKAVECKSKPVVVFHFAETVSKNRLPDLVRNKIVTLSSSL